MSAVAGGENKNVILRAANVDDGPKDLSDHEILRSSANDSVARDDTPQAKR